MPHKNPLEKDPIQFYSQGLSPSLVRAVGEVAHNIGEIVEPRRGVEGISISKVRDMAREAAVQEGVSAAPLELTKVALAARLTALNENKQ